MKYPVLTITKSCEADTVIIHVLQVINWGAEYFGRWRAEHPDCICLTQGLHPETHCLKVHSLQNSGNLWISKYEEMDMNQSR